MASDGCWCLSDCAPHQASNTGSDVHAGQFDLLVPAGGVGIYDACSEQWSVHERRVHLGEQYAECLGLPLMASVLPLIASDGVGLIGHLPLTSSYYL